MEILALSCKYIHLHLVSLVSLSHTSSVLLRLYSRLRISYLGMGGVLCLLHRIVQCSGNSPLSLHHSVFFVKQVFFPSETDLYDLDCGCCCGEEHLQGGQGSWPPRCVGQTESIRDFSCSIATETVFLHSRGTNIYSSVN